LISSIRFLEIPNILCVWGYASNSYKKNWISFYFNFSFKLQISNYQFNSEWFMILVAGCWTKLYFPTLVEVNIFCSQFHDYIFFFLEFRVISKIAFHFCQLIFWSIVSYSTETGHLSCSFAHGLCGWIQHREGDLHWETTADPSGIMVVIGSNDK